MLYVENVRFKIIINAKNILYYTYSQSFIVTIEFNFFHIFLQVVFEAVRGSSISGDIAIDDITFSTSKCSVVPSLAVPPTPPPTKPPPIINNCTFEGGFCSWKNLNGDDFDWTRSRGSTASWSTGPTVDHTKGTSQGILN